MNTFAIILGYSITLGLSEIIIFALAAILLGFSVHFYYSGRKSVPGIKDAIPIENAGISEDDEWRLQFYEQLEKHEKNQERLEKELLRMADAEKILIDELEERREEVQRLEKAVEMSAVSDKSSTRHISDLVIAQQNLNEYLSKEMTERLEKAYEEFSFLQNRMQKIQTEVIDPHNRNLEYEGLEQSYFRITKEYDELKLRHLTLMEEHQRVVRILADTEEKLRDANFRKQQLSKKVAFLEELTNDLQQVSGHHNRLEGQLKRISEIESILTRTASEGRNM